MGRRTWRGGMLGFAMGLVPACAGGVGDGRASGTFGGLDGDDHGQSFVDGESSGSDGDAMDPGACTIGSEGCACSDDRRCFEGLQCEIGVCVPPSGGPDDPTDDPSGMPPGDTTGDPTGDPSGDPTGDPTGEPEPAACGDGVLDPGEHCDDDNVVDGDGCPSTCVCETSVVDFDDEADLLAWTYDGDWRRYTATPPADVRPAVQFDSGVFGTDGNRDAPYGPDNEETEASSATSPVFALPSFIRFRSWHDDEGATHSGDVVLDNKRVLVRAADGEWTALVDCYMGPRSDLPMCPYHQPGPPTNEDWATIQLDLGAFAGQMGQIRFEYDTGDPYNGLERGWYVDDLQLGPCE